jgi:hypothetical protein
MYCCRLTPGRRLAGSSNDEQHILHASTQSARQEAITVGPSSVERELQRLQNVLVNVAATRDSENKVALDLLAAAAGLRREEQQRIRSCIALDGTAWRPLEELVRNFCHHIRIVVEGQAWEGGMSKDAKRKAKRLRRIEERQLSLAGLALLTEHQGGAEIDLGLWLGELVQTLQPKDANPTVSSEPRCLKMVKGLLDCIPGNGQDQDLAAAPSTVGPVLRCSQINAVANGGVAHSRESRNRLLMGASRLASGGAHQNAGMQSTAEVAMRGSHGITQKNRVTNQGMQSKDLVLPSNSRRPPAVPYSSLQIVRLRGSGAESAPPPPPPLSRFQFGVRSAKEVLPLPSLRIPPASVSFPTAWGLAMVGNHGAIPNADPIVPGVHAKPGNLDFLDGYS